MSCNNQTNKKNKIMETTTFLFVTVISLLITLNYDLEKTYNWISKKLYGNQTNICKY